ncbi:MAG: hypothetical protein GTO55_09100, partial [Armatimonadetes bacterium]|nr:hypothetical protein [Armatimonadota bacterium]NIM24403.1 hypothetical protein [Armatimonadota bacterium]NIM68274.1 hypothetical protein [Armatimonadota bacterium]NIM76678.1 hypothetical protein [Armatimonadota bacterium]NIN06477.1 hypothetical protein [Armatimonadota bacterium]
MGESDSPRVRILRSLAENEIMAEMRARGADYQAVEQLRTRASWIGAIFLGLPMEHSVNLRKKAKEVGVQAFLCRSLSTRGRGQEVADVILAGTAEDLKRLSESLQEKEGGLGWALAQAIGNWQGDRRREWHCGDRRLALGEKTLVMGILNVTPDSFSGDGLGSDGDIERGLQQAK